VGDAWARFYIEHRRGLTAYALALTGSVPDAHDLLHDVLVRMVAERYSPRDARAFVTRCLRNLAIDRRRTRRPTAASIDNVTAFLAASQNDHGDGQTIAAVRAALAELTESQREVVVLRTYAELTFQEIADVLDRPMGTVTSTYARALDALRRALDPEMLNAGT